MRKRIALSALLAFVAGVSIAAPAWSDEPTSASAGPDEVTLKNGGLVRGTIVSVEPGTKVVVLEPGAKAPRTIAWAEVADVERGKYDARPGAAGPGYATPAPSDGSETPASPDQVGVVRLHIDSPQPVRVFQNRVVTQGYVGGYGFVGVKTDFVCAAPCDRTIDARDGSEFVVEGNMPGTSFRLDDQRGDVRARVRPGSSGLRAGGFVAETLGLLGVITGGSLLLVGVLENGAASDSRTSDGTVIPAKKSSLVPIGGAIIGGSAAVLIGGIVMVIAGQTSVHVEPDAPRRASAKPRAPRYWRGEF